MNGLDWFGRLSADYSKHGSRALALYFAWVIALVGLVVVSYQALFSGANTCLGEAVQLQLSALEEAPGDQFTEVCDVDTFRNSMSRDLVLATVYLLGLGVFLATWWIESWDTQLERSRNAGPALAAVSVVTLTITAIANTLTSSNIELLRGNYQLELATTISTLSWIRWLLTGILVAGFVTTLTSWFIRGVSHIFRAIFDDTDPAAYVPDATPWPPPERVPPGFGICLSGGGIRSAAFSLGALSALEETPVDDPRPDGSAGLLGQADVISSVSGGGYAASAWRIAVGAEAGPTSSKPILGDPNYCAVSHRRQRFKLVSPPDTPTTELFPRLLARRKYLASGRGGLLVTAVWTVIQLLWHLGLLITVVGLLAWPIGRMISSPIITSANDSIAYNRLATPGVLVLGVVGVILILRSFTEQGRLRTISNYAVVALTSLGVGLLTLLVLLPWLVDWLIPELSRLLPGGDGAQSTIATVLTGGVVATVWRMIQAPLKTYAAYLGGALLAFGLILFGGLVSLHASMDDRLFSGSWTTWVIAVGLFMAVMSVVNPDLWSLHPVYRRRLASTFANRLGPGGWTSLGSRREHLPLSAYATAPGPKPIICTVAARMDRANTGVPVVSMTFEPDHVTVHPGPNTPSVAIPTAAYERLFGGRARARWLRSVMGLAAMSAAAMAPSLGRMSMGSTNALIAALNLRLGVWMPNPMYDRGRRAGTHMYSMFKEILGYFDLDDPNIYVTDGGHWENLGLVELIRRKTRIIISVDASADEPYSFNALMEAIELSLLECSASITFREGEFEDMQPGGAPRPPKNWCTAEITYADGSSGRLLFVKAQASEAMPLDVLRYSKEDPSFPNYSTANQFLSEAEFSNLAILGRESMIRALQDRREWLFTPSAERVPEPVPIPEVAASADIGYTADAVDTAETVDIDEPAFDRVGTAAGDEPVDGAVLEPSVVIIQAPAEEPAAVEAPVDDGPEEQMSGENGSGDEDDGMTEKVGYGEPIIKVQAPPPTRRAPTAPALKVGAGGTGSTVHH